MFVCFFGRVVLRELFREWGQMTGGHYEMRRRTNHSDSQQEEKQPPYLNPTQKTPRLLKFTDYSEVSIMKLIISQMLLPPLVFFLELGGSQGVRFHFKFCTQTAMCSSCRYLKPPPPRPRICAAWQSISSKFCTADYTPLPRAQTLQHGNT